MLPLRLHRATASLLTCGMVAMVVLASASGCGRTVDEHADTGSGGGAADAAGGDVARWATPPCDPVAVLDGVAVHDTGQEAYAIVPLDEPNVMLAHLYGILSRSVDAGCTWHRFPGAEPEHGDGFVGVAARAGGGAYATLARELVLVEGDAITHLPGPDVRDAWGGRSIELVAVHDTDPDQLVVRAVDEYFRSFDGGRTWSLAVRLPSAAVSHLAFDPRDLDHVLALDETGLSVTWDAGATWTRAMVEIDGRLSPAPRLSVRLTSYRDVVHGEEILDSGLDPAAVPRLFRSEDGSATFAAIDRPHGRDHLMPDGRVWRTRKLPGKEHHTWPGIELVRVDGSVERERAEIAIENVEGDLVTAPNGVLYVYRGPSAR